MILEVIIDLSLDESLNNYFLKNCGCGECTLSSIILKDCPNPKLDESVPIIRHNLVAKQELRTVLKLKRETIELIKKFKEVIKKTWQKLEEKQVPTEDVFRNFEFNYIFKDKDIIHDDRLLVFLGKNLTWFDCELMDDLINDFLKDDQDVTEVWAKYKDELKEYAKRRIEEYEGIQFALPPKEGFVPIYMAIDPAFEMKLCDLSTLTMNFRKILGLDKDKHKDIFLYGIRTGSIILTFVLPQSMYKNLFPLSGDQLLDLIELDIISLHIEEFHVFPDSEEWSFVHRNRPGKNTIISLVITCQ